MIWIVIFILGVLGGIILGVVYNKKKRVGIVGQQDRIKRENLKKITEFIKDREKVTNNDIENLLGVSDSTAERYLADLEQKGKVEQVGDTGRSVYYRVK